jgi:hypothetical protein
VGTGVAENRGRGGGSRWRTIRYLEKDVHDRDHEEDEDAILERARHRALGDHEWDEEDGTRARTTTRSGQSPRNFVLNQHKGSRAAMAARCAGLRGGGRTGVACGR